MSTASPEKFRGGYYTPQPLSRALCEWAIRSCTDTVLEPSCGDGQFLECAANRLIALGAATSDIARQVVGVEFLASEAAKAQLRLRAALGRSMKIADEDFFLWSEKSFRKQFDCVIGNPPFIRYQNFPEPSRSRAMALMVEYGLAPNRLTNIWVPFVVAAVEHLKPGGRLAMVLPAELLQVSYAAQLRSYLVDRFRSINIICCNDLVFKLAEQEVVLLRAEGKLSQASKTNRCEVRLRDGNQLDAVSEDTNGQTEAAKIVQHDSEKWLKYFLSAREIAFMRAMKLNPGIAPLSHHATIDVGIVTGRNDFFLVSMEQIDRFNLRPYVIPLIGRSFQLRGAVIGEAELQGFAEDGQRVHLLAIPASVNGNLHDKVKAYIREGESCGVHSGYKCSVRSPWYSVPSIWKPDGFFFRQIYDFPRVVVNNARATSTDTIHRLRCNAEPVERVAANIYTHLSAASAEIEGRSYGGGVLELEPTEAEKLLMPRALHDGLSVGEVDRLVRQGRLLEVLEQNDQLVLRQGIGLGVRDCKMLRDIWVKMRDRRMNRKKKQDRN